MRFTGLTFGVGFTGSFCTLSKTLEQIRLLKEEEGAAILPIMSYPVEQFDTKFGTAAGWKQELADIGCLPIITTIPEAEPIGPGSLLDVMLIAPCSGNTLAKLVHGITDSPVLMAAKAQLRNEKPLVLAIATNDGLGINAKNIGTLLSQKNIYLVPFGQDSPAIKPNSLIADVLRIGDTIEYALRGKQIQPLLLQYL